MSKKSRWLDGIPAEKKRVKNALSQTDRTDMGTVTEIMGDGNVAVHIDDSSEPDAVAPVVAGVTALGARVRLTRDSTGRVIQVEAPDRLPDGAVPVFVGGTGETVEKIADAQAEIDTAMGELDTRVSSAESDIATNRELADQAVEDAVKALTDAEAAASVANLAAAAAAGMIKPSQTDPGHQEGRLWFQLDSQGRTVGIKISDGQSWSSYALMADQVLVPGSAGATSIKDGAITTPKIFAGAVDATKITASEELWAKIGVFAEITTQMLVAGGATITGELLADVIQLATRLVAGDPAGDRTELNSAGIHIFKGGVERVRLSAEAKNGLQVYNPNMNSMVDLSDSMFGTRVFQRGNRLDIPPPTQSNAWGGWVFDDFASTFTATTNRVLVSAMAQVGDYDTWQRFRIRAVVNLRANDVDAVKIYDTGEDPRTALTTREASSMGVFDVVAGQTYTVRFQFRAMKADPSATGRPWISNRVVTIQPA